MKTKKINYKILIIDCRSKLELNYFSFNLIFYCYLLGIRLKLINALLSDGEYLIVATNSDSTTMSDYAKR